MPVKGANKTKHDQPSTPALPNAMSTLASYATYVVKFVRLCVNIWT